MMLNESLTETGLDLPSAFERDLTIIRRDIISVLQETANVRATMTDISSYKRGASKRFVVLSGLICFILLAALVICQSQLRFWLRMM